MFVGWADHLGNQECNALATVLWDNAFVEPVRIIFLLWIFLLDAPRPPNLPPPLPNLPPPLPMVVTVHGNQECNALATVQWDIAFAEPVIIIFMFFF